MKLRVTHACKKPTLEEPNSDAVIVEEAIIAR
jgi:hypothetical protein